ncbi:glycosyltransferase [Nocardia sp. alder85J]|uniref:glycosyltransferase n=1 Tax=Nocardia sp. alder85J TaxID=2862949 RepID=UPI001CD5745E|nr:glycosyltransferase [Nocardia sp. alder85J]MCX4098662.1 glycosyltransferase [Nocardia sp. alder85J]
MRIVQLANFYTPASGGLRTCVDEIGRGYLAAGHERVLVVPGLTDGDEHTPAGRRVTVRGPRFGGAGYHMLTARRTLPLLESLRPDVIECSDKLSVRWLAPWARRAGVPLVLFSHERIDAILRSRVPRGFPLAAAADVANRRLAARAAKIVVTSGFARTEFTRIGAGNVHRVPLGVDLDTFHPQAVARLDPDVVSIRPTGEAEKRPTRPLPVRPRAGLSLVRPQYAVVRRNATVRRAVSVSVRGDRIRHNGIRATAQARRGAAIRIGDDAPARPAPAGPEVRLVTVSRLSREKRPERAIEAVELLRDSGIRAELTVIGDGPLRERLQRRAEGLPVRFLGHLAERDAVAGWVAAADIAVCPSPAETFGLAVLEALACGTPVVVPHAGAARELLGPAGSGIECDGTAAGLAAGVRTLLTVPAPERRRAARLAAERFPWSTTVAGMLALYADCTAMAAGQ